MLLLLLAAQWRVNNINDWVEFRRKMLKFDNLIKGI